MKRLSFLVLVGAVINLSTCHLFNHEKFSFPCGSDSEIDIECVRDYISQQSSCSRVDSPKDVITIKDDLTMFLAKNNLTIITKRTDLSQLDGRITTFYVDNRLSSLIMSVSFEGVSCDSPDTIFAVSQRGRENKIVTEHAVATFPVELTAIISDGLSADSLQDAFYAAYFPGDDAVVNIEPKFSESDDPDIKSSFESLIEDIPTAVKEAFDTISSYIFLAYLQNSICDFKISPVVDKYEVTAIKNTKKVDNDESELTMPCDNNDDINGCVRKYFEDYSSGSVVREPAQEPIVRGLVMNHLPSINASVIVPVSRLSGIQDGIIQNFYINEKSHNLVMTIEFESIVMDAPICYAIMNQQGAPFRLASDTAVVRYPIAVTANIPIKKGLTSKSVEKAFVSAYFRESAIFELGPNFSESEDSQMQEMFAYLTNFPATISKELAITEAKHFFLAYLQNYICDFGIPSDDDDE